MADCLNRTNAKIVTIEKDPKYIAVATQLIDEAELEETVELHEGEAELIIPMISKPFGLVFIDHWKNLYLKDLKLLEANKLLKKGTVVVADNVGIFKHDLQEYLAYVRNSGKYSSRYYPSSMEYNPNIEDGIEVSILL